MQVGDWVLARSGYEHDEPKGAWLPAKLVEIDNTNIPWCVVFPGAAGARTWRTLDRARPPETDEEWAAVVAAQLTEGTDHG